MVPRPAEMGKHPDVRRCCPRSLRTPDLQTDEPLLLRDIGRDRVFGLFPRLGALLLPRLQLVEHLALIPVRPTVLDLLVAHKYCDRRIVRGP